MEIKILNKGYKNSEQFYKDFLDGNILEKEEYFSGEVISIKNAPDFPIYLNINSEKDRFDEFKEACDIISQYYLDEDRDVHFNEVFWHSLFCVYKRDYLLNKYPKIKESHKDFKMIVVKNFDWENYVYKSVIASQYILDNIQTEEQRLHYLEQIVKNLDLYNYIIKYEIFRNDKFLINILDIVYENNLSDKLKERIKHRSDLGKDERYGRRVIFEFNKSYPVVLAPTLEKEELNKLFIEHLDKYII